MIGRRREQAAEDAQTIARVRDAVEAHWRQGADAVPVAVLLDLFNPDGMWSRQDVGEMPVRPAQVPGDIDPLTGCRSVSAGSLSSRD